MRRIYLPLLCVVLFGLTGCPASSPTLPATTNGGGFLIETSFNSNGATNLAPLTNTTWTWHADGVNAAGNPATFQSVTNMYALDSSLNGRVSAQWTVTWNYTGYVLHRHVMEHSRGRWPGQENSREL